MVAGFLLSVLWYRRHSRQTGVETPARSYLITGVVLTLLATFVLPLLARWLPGVFLSWNLFFWVRGVGGIPPYLIIAAGLWMLAWAERSRALGVTALVYTCTALLVTLYAVSNLGFTTYADLAPATVLLVAGTGAFIAQRGHYRTRTA